MGQTILDTWSRPTPWTTLCKLLQMGLSVKNNSIIKMVHTISITGHTQISFEPPVVICKLLHKNNFRIKWGGWPSVGKTIFDTRSRPTPWTNRCKLLQMGLSARQTQTRHYSKVRCLSMSMDDIFEYCILVKFSIRFV